MKKITRAGVDIAKNVFHVYAIDTHGNKCWSKRLKRDQWLDALCERLEPDAQVAMEACGGAHHWGRELGKRGFHVRLIAAQFVKPFLKGNKTDELDAEAICTALCQPKMRFVSVKTVAQQDLQAEHRIRQSVVHARTAKVNQIRGLMSENGIVAPVGISQLRRALPRWFDDEQNGLSEQFRVTLSYLMDDLSALDSRLEKIDARIEQWVKSDQAGRRLTDLRGVGIITASALAYSLGDGKQFNNGRGFAASLGLVPKQHSSGEKSNMLGISKRGDGYLRKLLVHGARTVFQHAHKREDALSRWVMKLSQRKHANVVIVALANKMARMAWALISKAQSYEPALASEAVQGS